MISEAIAGSIELAQATLNDRGSFTEYMRAILASRELAQFGVLVLFGTLGMAGNYLWKWLRDEIAGSLWAYVVHQYPKRTALAFATILGYAATTVLSPVLDGAGWGVVVNMGLTTGFAIDALVNKSNRQPWTEEQRRDLATPKGPQP